MRFVTLGADETGAPVGTHTVTAEVEVAPDGTSWSGSFRFDIAAADGRPQGSVSGSVTGTPISTGAAAGR
jgi:hypothetical protein